MNKPITPDTISKAIANFSTLSEEELEDLAVYLNNKDTLGHPLSIDEEHLMSLIPAFSPDDDDLVYLGDYVDDREIASAEFGYDIYDKAEMLGSVQRRLANGIIDKAEQNRLYQIWGVDVSNPSEFEEYMKAGVSE